MQCEIHCKSRSLGLDTALRAYSTGARSLNLMTLVLVLLCQTLHEEQDEPEQAQNASADQQAPQSQRGGWQAIDQRRGYPDQS